MLPDISKATLPRQNNRKKMLYMKLTQETKRTLSKFDNSFKNEVWSMKNEVSPLAQKT